MKLTNSFISIRSASLHVLCATCVLSVSSSITSSVHAADPAWWDAKGATNAGLTAEDYAPANLGQLKKMAKSALQHFDDNLPAGWKSGGLGKTLDDQVSGFVTLSPANYSPVNLGQIKAVAKPYYDFLIGIGYDTRQNLIDHGYPATWAHPYPWDPATPGAQNYFPANLGQLKAIFCFSITSYSSADTDADTYDDWWEYSYFGTIDGPLPVDPDGDGLTTAQEYTLGLNPLHWDTDGDGLPDKYEHDSTILDPNLASDATLNPDGDGWNNFDEYVFGFDPEVYDNIDRWVSAGYQHTLLQDKTGNLFAMGLRANGRLGIGNPSKIQTPTKVDNTVTFTQVAMADNHVLALASDGTVWAWGSNGSGRLGINSTVSQTRPQQVLALNDVIAIDAGFDFSIALRSDGSVWAWGDNGNNQLGSGDAIDSYLPQLVNGLDGTSDKAVSIAAGYRHALAVLDDGSVKAWGYNPHGQLGNGDYIQQSTPVDVSSISTATKASAGDYHTLILLSDGTVRSFGNNGSGRLGNDSTTNSNIPVTVIDGPSGTGSPIGSGTFDVIDIACGSDFSLAVMEDGSLMAWGENASYRLGDGTENDRHYAIIINGFGPSGDIAKEVAAGDNWSFAILDDATVKGWGYNAFGNLGNGNDTTQTTPVAVSILTDVKIIDGGNVASAAIAGDGSLYTWGQIESNGILANGLTSNYAFVPIAVDNLNSVTVFSAGFDHSLALKSGSVYVWGDDGNEALGDPALTSDQFSPVALSTISNAVEVAAGRNFSSSIVTVSGSEDGQTWGLNADGQLGNNSIVTAPSPVSIDTSTGIGELRSLATGDYHTVALDQNGELWSWGQNVYGQLGLGTSSTTDVLQPTKITSITGFVAVSAGSEFSMALKDNGDVYAWGRSDDGQLGQGNMNTSTSPVKVTLPAHVVAITCGDSHSLALLHDGRVFTWGLNANPLGSLENKLSPVRVTNINNAIAIAAGYRYSIALDASGEIWGWGISDNGQIGGGSDADTVFTPRSAMTLSGFEQNAAEKFEERLHRLFPESPDTNANGIYDPLEARYWGSYLDDDYDLDGLSAYFENVIGTDPLRYDTDGDGIGDGADAFPLDPDLQVLPINGSDTQAPLITLSTPENAIKL